eukprot:14111683-Alexandrium_andersonii.AAC.1
MDYFFTDPQIPEGSTSFDMMAPGRGAGSLATPVSTRGAGEWKQVQGRGAAWRAQQPQKSVRTG